MRGYLTALAAFPAARFCRPKVRRARVIRVGRSAALIPPHPLAERLSSLIDRSTPHESVKLLMRGLGGVDRADGGSVRREFRNVTGTEGGSPEVKKCLGAPFKGLET